MVMMMMIMLTMKTMKMVTAVISGRSVENQNVYSFVVGHKIPLQQCKFFSEGIQSYLVCLLASKIRIVEWIYYLIN